MSRPGPQAGLERRKSSFEIRDVGLERSEARLSQRRALDGVRGVKEYAPMDPATRDRLALLFEPDNRRLERLLGRELGVRPHTPATRPR